jgi:hypothetical protein
LSDRTNRKPPYATYIHHAKMKPYNEVFSKEQQAAPQHTPATRKGMSRGKKIGLIIGGIFAFFILVGAIGASSSNTNTSNTTGSTSAQPDNTSSQQSQPAKVSPTPAQQPQVLLDLSGNGTKTTQKFTAASDWDLNWSYDCTSFGNSDNFQVMIYNGDGSLSTDNALVNRLGSKDSGVEHYHTGGTFYLVVNSECSWHATAKG